MSNLDLTNPVNRVRMLTGDLNATEPYFEDSIYQYYLDQGNSEQETAIEILEATIAAFSLNPTRERSGSYEAYGQNLKFLQDRLESLKQKKVTTTGKTPVLLNPGQRSWQWLDDLFGREK